MGNLNKKKKMLYNQGLIDKEIAEELDLTPSAICYWRNQRNLEPNGRIDGKIEKEIYQYYDDGLSDRKIARKTSFTPSAICHWRKRNNLESNSS